MFKGREILKSQQKKRYFQINGIARMPWLPAPHQEGLLFSGKMLLGWGVVVSDASELLFEHIKKTLKLQYFGYLMRRIDLLGKSLMLGKIEGRRG